MRISEIINPLLEARIDNIEVAVGLFVKLIEKYSKTPLYRYGGNSGTVQINNGIGILFLSGQGPAYQFNYIRGKIESITVWKNFNFKPGNYTIDFGGMNLAQIGKRLINHVLNPQVGEYEYNLQESNLKESVKRRATSREFLEIISKNLSPGQQIDSLSIEDIRIIADGAGVQVPTAVRGTKVDGTKGINMRFDLRKLLDVDIENKNLGTAEEKRLKYHISVTPQDPETNAFMSPKGNTYVDNMVRRFQDVLRQDMSPEEEEQSANEIFTRMESLVRLIARPNVNVKSLIIYGGPGTGKTFTVKKTLKDEGLAQNQDWFMIKGKVTTAELYRSLYMHRKGSILVFDDTDSVWADQEAGNILKAALDSHDERMISWYSNRTFNVSKLSPEKKEEYYRMVDDSIEEGDPGSTKKFPSEFIYDGKIIFISNLTRDKFDDAVLSRSAKIDMSLTSHQMFSRLKHVLPDVGDSSVPLRNKEEILQFLIDEHGKGLLESPTMRSFVSAENVYLSGMPNWKDLFYYL